jgi:AcrR family transcriptional regulator
LIDVAEVCFAESGYAAASLDAIVAGAGVTKGALYHHFSGKQALFDAVFERVEDEASRRIQRALKGERDPWAKALAGLRAFLAVVQEPGYRRIVIQEGPSVLGYERFREQEERSTFANVLDIVRAVLESGRWQLDEPVLQTYARIFFGAMSSAGESVATAADPEEAAELVEGAIAFLLSGVQMMVESGVEPPTALTAAPRRATDE